MEKIINNILIDEFHLLEYFKVFKSLYFLNYGHLMSDFLTNLFNNMDNLENVKNANSLTIFL